MIRDLFPGDSITVTFDTANQTIDGRLSVKIDIPKHSNKNRVTLDISEWEFNGRMTVPLNEKGYKYGR